MKKAIKNKLVIGILEVCSLPDLGMYDLKIKVDTGAKTSPLHVDNVTQFEKMANLGCSLTFTLMSIQ